MRSAVFGVEGQSLEMQKDELLRSDHPVNLLCLERLVGLQPHQVGNLVFSKGRAFDRLFGEKSGQLPGFRGSTPILGQNDGSNGLIVGVQEQTTGAVTHDGQVGDASGLLTELLLDLS